jgi:hypothetical protein
MGVILWELYYGSYIMGVILWELYTVKLGYNELGYNELPVITNRFFQFFQSQIQAYSIIQPGYNESRL